MQVQWERLGASAEGPGLGGGPWCVCVWEASKPGYASCCGGGASRDPPPKAVAEAVATSLAKALFSSCFDPPQFWQSF